MTETTRSAGHVYDVALSFAGEDRRTAEGLARLLTSNGWRVFYDSYEEADLLGKDLYQHLQRVYRDLARYCVILISDGYAQKVWPRHELRQAQARAFRENEEYILPLRLSDAELPGLNATTGYLDLRLRSMEEVAVVIQRKLVGALACDTWPETPTALSEFSDNLRSAVTDRSRAMASELVTALEAVPSPSAALHIIRSCLGGSPRVTHLDIEVTCLDSDGVYVYHPWPGVQNQTLESQWAVRRGFADWVLGSIAHRKRGYLTWRDQYSSDPALEQEVWSSGRRYERRTLVAFETLMLAEVATAFTIAVEGHEVHALGARSK